MGASFLRLGVVVAAALFSIGAAAAETTVEPGVDRFGSDYSGTDLSAADPALCRAACDADGSCKAYTYVKPGVQGPSARCYLKDAVPPPTPADCCVSGVKVLPSRSTAPTRAAPPPAAIPAPDASAGAMTTGPFIAKVFSKPTDPGPLGRGQAVGSLTGKDPKASAPCADATKNAIVAVLDKLAEWFGGDVSYDARCGNFERELSAGVTLGKAPASAGNAPKWPQLGGSGGLMADSMLCLMKDVGDAPDGRITRKNAHVSVGDVGISVEQTIGLKKFDPVAKRAELWHQVRLCAPVMGCMDAQRQNIAAEGRASIPAWPGGMKSGDYPIANSYSLDVAADWANSTFGAKTPPITVTTPYGSASLEAKFSYFSSLYPVDTPFNHKGGQTIFMNHPSARGPDKPLTDDVYGRSGLPLILNIITNHTPPEADCSALPPGQLCLPPADPAPPPSGWSSQLLFGARNGVGGAAIWSPGGAKWPERGDLDLDLARSALDHGPTASFVAEAPVTIKPPVQDLLEYVPPGAKDLIGDIGLTITVTPEFSAYYAAQLGLIEREGRLGDCWPPGKEFGGPCGLSEALLYAQTRAEGAMKLKTGIHFWIDFTFDTPFYDPDIDFADGFEVPIGGPNKAFDPGKASAGTDPYVSLARASRISIAPGKTVAEIVKGLSGMTHGDISQWTDVCLKTPPASTSSLPEPTHEPGSPDDLKPELLPCNICVADSKQNKYKPFVFPEVKAKVYSASKSWTCAWEQNLGCHDLCSWTTGADGKPHFDKAVISAVDQVGDRCKAPPPPVIK